jgi:type I restriction enzyme S subunit
MSFPSAPLAEQSEIVSEVERRLSVESTAEAQAEASLKRAERLRQSILKQAFEGRLVEQDASDEPASALLARMRAGREQHLQSRALIAQRQRAEQEIVRHRRSPKVASS